MLKKQSLPKPPPESLFILGWLAAILAGLALLVFPELGTGIAVLACFCMLGNIAQRLAWLR